MNESILAAIAAAQMGTNSMLSDFALGIIAVIQDHKLDVTEDVLNRVVVGAAFGQADPMELEVTHGLAGLA